MALLWEGFLLGPLPQPIYPEKQPSAFSRNPSMPILTRQRKRCPLSDRVFVTFGSARPGWHRVDLHECWICWGWIHWGAGPRAKNKPAGGLSCQHALQGQHAGLSSGQGLLTILPELPVPQPWLSCLLSKPARRVRVESTPIGVCASHTEN